MGRRGPAPKPTRLKLLAGETRPSRINRDEPQPVDRLPALPLDMGDRARQVWERVMRDFGHTGVIKALDTDALRIYCESVAAWEQAEALLRQSGPLIKGRDGNLVRNPLAQIARDNATMVRIYARELGLTPAARVGLHAEAATPATTSTLQRLRSKRASG